MRNPLLLLAVCLLAASMAFGQVTFSPVTITNGPDTSSTKSADLKSPSSCDPVSVLPFTENFDSPVFPPLCWTTSPENRWIPATTGTHPVCTPHSGTGMAEYNSYWYVDVASLITPGIILPNNNCRVDFWMFRDTGYPSNDDYVTVSYNTVQSVTGATLLGTIHRFYYSSPQEPTSNLWYHYQFLLPVGYTGSPIYVIFNGVPGNGNNIFIDDVTIGENTRFLTSVTVTQGPTTSVLTPSGDNPILMMDYLVTGNLGTLPLNSVTVTSSNSDVTDVDLTSSAVQLYRTTTPVFTMDNPLGPSQGMVSGSTTFSNLNYNLPTGHTYIWVTYDISQTGAPGHTVDAKILANAINVGGATFPQDNQDPYGNRTIACGNVNSFPLTETFDSPVFPPNCWTNISATPWIRATSGTYPTCSPHSGAGMAEFASYTYAGGTSAPLITKGLIIQNGFYEVVFWMYRDDANWGFDDRVAVYYNTSQSLTGAIDLGTVRRNYSLPPAEPVGNQWYEYTFKIPVGYSGSPIYIIFRGVSGQGKNIFIDDISIRENKKALTSMTVTQGPTTPVFLGSSDNPILMLDFLANDLPGILKLNSIVVKSFNSDYAEADISTSGVKLYTTTTPVFSTANPLGTAQSLSNHRATFTFLGYNLPAGHTYVWVTNDLSSAAVAGHTIDALIESNAINVNSTTYPAVYQDPSGNRTITCLPVTTFPMTESFDLLPFPAPCWTNASTYPWARVTSGTNPVCTPHSGAGMVDFACRTYTSNQAGTLITNAIIVPNNNYKVGFWMYRDNGYPSATDRVAVYYNTVQSQTGATDLGTVNRYYGSAPAEATPNQWYHYEYDMPAGLAGTPVYIVFYGVSGNGNNIFMDDVTVSEKPKSLTSITVTQGPATPVAASSSDNPILMLDYLVATGPGILNLNSVAVTGANFNSTNEDIANSGVKLYRTATPEFSTANMLGTAQSFGSNTASFSGLNYDLPVGHTYVWVTFDIAAGAVGGHPLDARILANSINAGGNTYPATVQDPAGNRTVICSNITDFPMTESFDELTFIPFCWTNESPTPWSWEANGLHPVCLPHSGSGMVEFHSYFYGAGSTGSFITPGLIIPDNTYMVDFWMYRDNLYPWNYDNVTVYCNTIQSLSGATELGTINRNYLLSPAEVTANQWYHYHFNLPVGYTGLPVYLIFNGVSQYGNDIFMDDITVARNAKELSSVTITQGPSTPVPVFSPDNPILMMDYLVTGDAGILILNSIAVTSANSDLSDADIDPSGVKLYITSSPTFSTTNLLGTAQSFIEHTASFTTLAYDLPSGHTYVWVAYDIAQTAVSGHNVDAKILAGGINVEGATFNTSTDDPSGNRTITTDKMLYQVFVSQASVENSTEGSSTQEILKFDFNVTGATGTMPLNSIIVTSANSDLSDAAIAPSGVKLYRTSSPAFSTDNLLGTAQSFIANTASFSNLAYDLPAGHTYVWVTYDLVANSGAGTTVDAKILANAINVGGSTYLPTIQDPSGSRTITCVYVSSYPYTETFDGAIFPPACWTNDATNPWTLESSGIHPVCLPHSGNGMAMFNSFSLDAGLTGALVTKGQMLPDDNFMVDFWMFRDDLYSTALDRVDVYYNITPGLGGATYLGTINRHYMSSPEVPVANQWYEYNFPMPAGASGSPGYFIFNGISEYGSDIFIDDVTIRQSTKVISGVTVNQGPTTTVTVSTTDNPVLMMDYHVIGNNGTLNLNSVTVTSANSDVSDADVASGGVKLYQTSTPAFSTANPLGTAQSFEAGTAIFSNLGYDLPSGHSYVWVAYDIADGAVPGHTVDARILADAININGLTYPATDQDPFGNRKITCSVVSNFPLTDSFDDLLFPSECWANASIFNWARVTEGTYPSCAPHSGPGMAAFSSHSYPADVTGQLITKAFLPPDDHYRVKFWMYRDDGFPDNWDRVTVYYNNYQTVDGSTFIGGVSRHFESFPAESSPNQWFEYQFDLPAGSGGIPGFIILDGYSKSGEDLYIDDFRIESTVIPSAKFLTVKAYLEGFYDATSGLMNKAQDVAPDGETQVDKWPGTQADTISILLVQDLGPVWPDPVPYDFEAHGQVLNTDGTASINTIPAALSGDYYIILKHRQSVETWSAFPVPFATDTIFYDFTTAAAQASGDNQRQLVTENSIYGLWGGEINGISGIQDGYVDIFDNVMEFNSSQDGRFGYLVEDVTGIAPAGGTGPDGFVDIYDMVLVFNNMQNGVGMNTPPVPMKKK